MKVNEINCLALGRAMTRWLAYFGSGPCTLFDRARIKGLPEKKRIIFQDNAAHFYYPLSPTLQDERFFSAIRPGLCASRSDGSPFSVNLHLSVSCGSLFYNYPVSIFGLDNCPLRKLVPFFCLS